MTEPAGEFGPPMPFTAPGWLRIAVITPVVVYWVLSYAPFC